jgi:hypothetical protein
MSRSGNCIVRLRKLKPGIFFINVFAINFFLPPFLYHEELTYMHAISKLLATPIDIMDNHPDATQLFQALTIGESLNASPEAEKRGVKECEREKVRKCIAKQFILLAVRFKPIRWDANYANMLTVADPPFTGDMIRVL